MGVALDPPRWNDTTARDIVGAVIAYVLLFLYAFSVGYMILQVITCGRTAGCGPPQFGKSLLYIVTTVGGLVSALVVARLAVASPGGEIRIANASTESPNVFSNIIAWGYVTVWFIVGLGALIVGDLLFPDVSQTVADLGTAWLGLAVAATYAYFGIEPSNSPQH